ncbi:hypothetical protein [Actinotalea fermentans]|uniref:Uncharacterized protein n=1 Tax=Actinotalea fermentans TaxID=43671 RepID=A0A511YTP9_9CELL|nr:hypothetical protein [Actinotalea fermentans]KGM17760.1 hypothetical protein N867_13735 [Actinotalea fermentans ATCC 43279 = JCM 9966 = DSM 3133]GEN78571.1 hypothetical protein AFE02nite_03050 [Actinotalea fermentans]
MTLTDDELVRSLAEQVDRALPTMSLDPAALVAGGRRYRRRRTAARAAGGLGATLALVAVVVAQGLTADRDGPAGPEQIVVGDLTVTAAVAAVATETSEGMMYDLGLPRDAARPEGSRVVLDAEPGWLGLRPFDPSTGSVGQVGAGMGFSEPPVGGTFSSGTNATLLGVVRTGETPELVLDGTPARSLPTFRVPGVDGRVLVLSISGRAGSSTWPTVAVRLGTDADSRPIEVALENTATSAVWSPTSVGEVDTDLGPAIELGGPGMPGGERGVVLIPRGTEAFTDPATAAADLHPWGDLTGAPLATLRWPAETSSTSALDDVSDGAIVDGVAYLVGVVPSDATTVVARVGDTRVPLGTFTMSQLPGRQVYVAAIDVAGADPLPTLGVEYRDGRGLSTSGWVLLP